MKVLKNVCIILLLFCGVGLLNAQSPKDLYKQLSGIWDLQNVSIIKVEGKDSTKITVNAVKTQDVNWAIFEKLEFKSDSLKVFWDNTYFSDRVGINETQIEFSGTPTPLSFNYQINNNILLISRRYIPSSSANSTISYNILYTYTNKE